MKNTKLAARILALLVAVLATVAILTACGGETETPTETPTTEAAPATTVAPDASTTPEATTTAAPEPATDAPFQLPSNADDVAQDHFPAPETEAVVAP